MKRAMRWCAAASLLLALHGVQAVEKVYRWVDPDGGVHYSATPPPGMALPESDVDYIPTPDPAAAAQQLQQYQDTVNKRREDQKLAVEANAKAAEKAEKRRSRCEQARGIMQRLQENSAGIRYPREDGSFARYDDADRERKLGEARKAAAESCS